MNIYLCYIPIIILAFYYLFNSLVRRNSQTSPPSPATCLPIIGHFHILKEPFHHTLANLADRFGPILSLRFGSRPDLLVSSPSAAEECLSKNDIVFCNRPSGFLTAKHLAFNYTSLIWAPYGPHWRNLRRITTVEILSSNRLKSLAGIRSEEVKLMIQRLRELCGSSSSSEVVLKPLVYDVSMNVMTRMIFGKRYYGVEGENNGEKFREMLAKMLTLFNDACIGDMIPCLRWLDWWKEGRLRKFDVERRMIMKELIEEHKEKMMMVVEDGNEEFKVKPLIQILLRLQELEPEYYNDEIIFGIILDLLIGSSDTSAETIEWALSLLLNHPQVLNKAKHEIHNHVGYERLLNESDLNHLPYLRCIINETLRMYPPAPNLVPHESSENCMVGGYHIPRGTMLQINLWAIQNNPNIWDDPTTFRPERFEGVEGHKIGYKMMPFGSGRRSCPGEGLASRVVGLTLGSIIQCFELDKINFMLVDMTKAVGFNLQKAEPLRALVRPCPAMMSLLDQIV
ncbi:cytochrome P450 81Q32 [Beta vulgaris subsp. vulgaris]|nr:cytochrome P450 81Q32 [Beta vulgaris subsp. vulgaris]